MMVTIVAVASLLAQGPAVRVDVSIERATIDAGEPLVISVRADNRTELPLILFHGELTVEWKVRSPDGRVVCVNEPPYGRETVAFGRTVPPHASLSFRVVAHATAAIKRPGRYKLEARYDPEVPGYTPAPAPSIIPFQILPRDPAALANRSKELHDAAVDRSKGVEANMAAAEELATLDYSGSRALLCDVLKSNGAAMPSALRRLEIHPDQQMVACLVEQIRSPEPSTLQDAIRYALKGMLRNTEDPKLRAAIEAAIGK